MSGPQQRISVGDRPVLRAWPPERIGYAVAGVLMLSGLTHLVVLITTGESWQGPLSLRKPMTFGLSFGLTLVTIVWVASYLQLGRRERTWLLGAFTVASVVEVLLITVQAWRHVPSHFNMETPVDSAIARVLAVGGGVLVVVIGLLTAASFRTMPGVAPSMRLAVRAGLLALDVALLIGALMIAVGVARVMQGDQQAAYAVGGAFKPGHAVTMHGVLVLPVMAWLLARSERPEDVRVRVMWWAVAGYALLCAVVVGESLTGIDPLHAPIWLMVTGGLGTIAIAAAGVITMAAAVGARARTPSSSSAASRSAR
jgi:hypothetical protein